MVTFNDELADRLAELAALLRAARGDRFRVRAYQRAARTVRGLPVDLTTMTPQDVRRLEGIGNAIAGLIAEFADTGGLRLLDELRQAEPPGVGALLNLPLIGLRDARTLVGAGLTDIAAVQRAAATPGGLARVDDRLAGRVRESLRRLATSVDSRAPLPLAQRDARRVAQALGAVEEVDEVAVAGAVRRGVDTVEMFDLVVVGPDPAAARAAVLDHPAVLRPLDHDTAAVTVMLASGRPARLWFSTPAGAGAALVHATGSDEHVAHLQARAAAHSLELRPDGLWNAQRLVAGGDEEAVYAALGLPPVPTEVREGGAELDAAERGELGNLVTQSDLCGDLHVHSDWSRDGKASLEDMVAAAAARGYAYVAITDHAENLRINGMSRETVLARRASIAALQSDHPQLRILDAAELNIGLDGSLDYDLEFLLEFDLGVASIHSHMDRPSAVQTDRILAAIAHPAVHVIGHPTGRIIGHRPGYEIEMTAIAQAAAETGTALEVNGSARRLDLAGDLVAIAVRAGALVSLSSDAHSVAELDAVRNAVPTARRGWATCADVVNGRPLEWLLGWARAKRARAAG
jgi:DNA polymerase (family X)